MTCLVDVPMYDLAILEIEAGRLKISVSDLIASFFDKGCNAPNVPTFSSPVPTVPRAGAAESPLSPAAAGLPRTGRKARPGEAGFHTSSDTEDAPTGNLPLAAGKDRHSISPAAAGSRRTGRKARPGAAGLHTPAERRLAVDSPETMTKTEAIAALVGLARAAAVDARALRALSLVMKALARAAVHKHRSNAAQRARGLGAHYTPQAAIDAVPQNPPMDGGEAPDNGRGAAPDHDEAGFHTSADTADAPQGRASQEAESAQGREGNAKGARRG